jgi:hypothetical protein
MAVKVGSFAKSTSGAPASQAITGLDFRPKALLLWTVGATAVDTYAGGIKNAIGMTDGTTQGSCAASMDDGTANTNAGRNTARKALTICDGDGATLAECDLTSFNVDGFTLSWTTNNASAYLINYLAIGGDDLTNVKVLEWQLATSTGNQAVTGVGFQPDAMIGICGSRATLGTGTQKAVLMLAVSVGTDAWSSGWSCEDARTFGLGWVAISSVDFNDPVATRDYGGILSAVGADGFTYNWVSEASDTFYAYQLCLKGGSYAQALTTKPTGAAPATQTINSLGFDPEGVLLALGNDTLGQYGITLTLGASDGTDERCSLITDEYAAGTIEAKNFASDTKTLVQDYSEGTTKPDQATDSAADLSLVSGGFALVWNPNDANASKMVYLALATGAGEDPLNLQASGASTSAGTANLRIGLNLVASGASTSAGSANFKNMLADDVLLTQVGLLVDADSTPPVQVTQAGALVDVLRRPPAQVTQAGAIIDAERTPPLRVTQAGAMVDVNSTPPLRVTQAGLMIDARYQRPESELNCWEFWVEDIIGHHLAYLDGATNKAYLEALSDCGGGTFTISSHDPKATTANLAVGNIVKVRYRNVDIGAWMIENIQDALVGPGESAEQAYVVSGRGLLALLEHGLVYPSSLADAGTAEREFTGVSKAKILLDLYAEFVLRGGGELNMAFYAEYDSSGQAFTDTVVLNFKAGQNLLDVARNLAGLGLELTVDPDRTLQAWNTAGVDRSATICFRQGQSVMSSRRTTEGIGLTNVVLGEGQGLFVESKDTTSITSHRRRESYLPVRNTDDAGQVGVANDLLLAGWKEPRSAYTLEVLADPFYPFFDYHVGDVVAISIPDELEGDYRILGISINEVGGPCDLRVTLEINDLATEYLHKLQLAFDASLMSVRPGPAAASGLASSGTEPVVGASGTYLGPGAVKSAQVDWGTGPGQVSAANMPIADAGSYFTGMDVEAALQETLLSNGRKTGATSQMQRFGYGVILGAGETNYLIVDSSGWLGLSAGAHVHRSVTIPPSAMIPDPTNPPVLDAIYGNLLTYKFSYSTDKFLYFQIEMPSDWCEGSTIRPYVHWAGKTNGLESASVGWTLEYSWTNAGGIYGEGSERRIGETIDAASAGIATANTLSSDPPDVLQAYEHYAAPFGLAGFDDGIPGTGKKIRSVLLCRLNRNTGMGQIYGDVFLIAFDVIYEVDALGSKGIEDKWVYVM